MKTIIAEVKDEELAKKWFPNRHETVWLGMDCKGHIGVRTTAFFHNNWYSITSLGYRLGLADMKRIIKYFERYEQMKAFW
jgi:hypothetical protein